MRRKRIVLIVLALVLALAVTGCAKKEQAPSQPAEPAGTEEQEEPEEEPQAQEEPAEEPEAQEEPEDQEEPETYTYTMEDVEALTDTKYFLNSAIEHIFCGTINKKGAATGYHYDGIEDTPGYIVEGTKSEPDENGVYTAKVEVDGIAKTGNRGYSSFYPEFWTPQDVIDAINEAYENKEKIGDDLYAGLTSEGIEIDMALTNKGKIITAYPVKED